MRRLLALAILLLFSLGLLMSSSTPNAHRLDGRMMAGEVGDVETKNNKG